MYWFRNSLLLVVVLFGMSCSLEQVQQVNNYLDFDSLIHQQVVLLEARKVQLEKDAMVNGESESTTSTPDSVGWSNELEVFKDLNLINSPKYSDHYQFKSRQEDTNSNLFFSEYVARTDVPLTTLRVYFLTDWTKPKRVYGRTIDENALYQSTKEFELEFEEIGEQLLISKYRVEGVQKMILGDSVQFRVSGSMRFPD